VAGTTLGAGDKILVREGAFAVVAYDDCAVSISKPAIVTVTRKAPCIAGQQGELIQPVLGTPQAAPPPLPLVLGFGAVVIGGIVVFGVMESDKDAPTSSP
jgi:hypothetical protein